MKKSFKSFSKNKNCTISGFNSSKKRIEKRQFLKTSFFILIKKNINIKRDISLFNFLLTLHILPHKIGRIKKWKKQLIKI